MLSSLVPFDLGGFVPEGSGSGDQGWDVATEPIAAVTPAGDVTPLAPSPPLDAGPAGGSPASEMSPGRTSPTGRRSTESPQQLPPVTVTAPAGSAPPWKILVAIGAVVLVAVLIFAWRRRRGH